jgi:hypothetical protein
MRAARKPYLARLGDSEPLIPTYLEYLKGMLRFDFGSMPAPRKLGMGMIPVTKWVILDHTPISKDGDGEVINIFKNYQQSHGVEFSS